MTRKSVTKVITEGHYAAEVDVELLYDDSAWSPYLSAEDATRLDDVRLALRNRDLQITIHHRPLAFHHRGPLYTTCVHLLIPGYIAVP